MPYEISFSSEAAITVVKLKGTMVGPNDRGTFQNQIQELLDKGQLNMVLDLGEVTFADSSGIGALIAAGSSVTRTGGCMKLLHVTKRIHDVLQITRLSSIFGIYDNLQSALESFETQA